MDSRHGSAPNQLSHLEPVTSPLQVTTVNRGDTPISKVCGEDGLRCQLSTTLQNQFYGQVEIRSSIT